MTTLILSIISVIKLAYCSSVKRSQCILDAYVNWSCISAQYISGNAEIIKNLWLSYDTHMSEGTVSGFQAVSLVKLVFSERTHMLINLSARAYFFLQRTFKRYQAHAMYHHFFSSSVQWFLITEQYEWGYLEAYTCHIWDKEWKLKFSPNPQGKSKFVYLGKEIDDLIYTHLALQCSDRSAGEYDSAQQLFQRGQSLHRHSSLPRAQKLMARAPLCDSYLGSYAWKLLEVGLPPPNPRTEYKELLQTEMSLRIFSYLPLLSACRIWQGTTLSNGLGKSPPRHTCLTLSLDCANALLYGHGAKLSLWFFHRWSRRNDTLVSAWEGGMQGTYHFLVTLKRAWK